MSESVSVCRLCGRKIRHADTANHKTFPLDAEPSPEGNIDLSSGVAVVVSPGETLPGIPLYTSHLMTCPHAAKPRR